MEDSALRHQLLRSEPLVVAVPAGHALASREEPLRLADLADETVIVYPKYPRPSYADRVLDLAAQDHGRTGRQDLSGDAVAYRGQHAEQGGH